MQPTEFTNIQRDADGRTVRFTLSSSHVSYANTLRRLILTGVETIAFRADMTSTGTTTDVVVKRNDTPMTNEMLAARIGLLPVHVPEPLKWRDNEYQFRLHVGSDPDHVRHVTASDFEVTRLTGLLSEEEKTSSRPVRSVRPSLKGAPKGKSFKGKSQMKKGGDGDSSNNEEESEINGDEDKDEDDVDQENDENEYDPSDENSHIEASNKDSVYDEKEDASRVPSSVFFPPHPLTGQTCLLASLQPGSGATQQRVEILAKASKGTGREHARFSPVSQCSYEYSLDNNPERIREMFESWLIHAKKATSVEKGSERYSELEREFNTMQIKRCYKMDEKGEPYSYDFTIESVGVLSVDYIVKRACEVGENMCSLYVNLDKGSLPSEITISNANCRMIGYDFLFRGHDHTLGNLLQTWLVQHHIEGNAKPKIQFAGFSVPHPLRDEMVLRIGVEDGEETTARAAIAAAARGCISLFKSLRYAWLRATGAVIPEDVSLAPSELAASSVARSSKPAASALSKSKRVSRPLTAPSDRVAPASVSK
jgi:DNA-directed RNA polymerase subunit L/DNA-directed RNA polymerase alpha subunit